MPPSLARETFLIKIHCSEAAETKVWYGAGRRPAWQRYQPFAAKSKTGLISLQQSLAVPVQFRDLCITKSRERTFVGEYQLLKLSGSSAASPDFEVCDLAAAKVTEADRDRSAAIW